MIILGFDTSNAYSSIAISNGPNILYAHKSYQPNTQAEKLVLMIEEALSSLKINYHDVEYLAASCGPGSFTGIRIALAAARGICLASDIKPICITNFQMINCRIREQYMNFDYAICSLNASRNQIYYQIFSKKEEFSQPQLVNLDLFYEYTQSLSGVKVYAGSGLDSLFNTEKINKNDSIILPRFAYPDARYACRVAHQHIAKNKINNKLDPLYIRDPDAKLPVAK